MEKSLRNLYHELELNLVNQTYVFRSKPTLRVEPPPFSMGTDVIDLDSGDFPDVTSSDVEDGVNLRERVLIVLSQACDRTIRKT